MANKNEQERKSIDATEFAILSFLSSTEYSAQQLRDLLKQYTQLEISRSPMYRRMRQLVDAGYVEEIVKPMNQNNLFSLTEKGEMFCLEWADTLLDLIGLTPYVPEKRGEE